MDQLESSLFDSENTVNTPKRRKPQKATDRLLNNKIVIDALLTLLDLPSCNQYIIDVSYLEILIISNYKLFRNTCITFQVLLPASAEFVTPLWNF